MRVADILAEFSIGASQVGDVKEIFAPEFFSHVRDDLEGTVMIVEHPPETAEYDGKRDAVPGKSSGKKLSGLFQKPRCIPVEPFSPSFTPFGHSAPALSTP